MILSVGSLFVGVLDIRLLDLLTGNVKTWEIFLIFRLPRLLAILCTGIGMSVAGLIMQQLCMNKFVSPTTGATISSAQFGILLALLFAPGSTLWGRAAFSFVCAVLGTWVFVWFIQRMEAVMACEPDIIFISGRLSKSYDALCEIAPVVFLATDTEKGVVESTRENALTIASIFGLEDHVEALMADFDSCIDALKAFAEGKTAIVGMTTSGSFNVLGNDGRCSIIGKEIGFENIGVDANIDTSTHGNEASFEFIMDKNPDYIFAMDRDAAIGTDGAQMAQEILENELVESTDAYKNGHVVYLAHPNVWYTAEGGIQALSEMLSDLESALL